MVVYRVTNLANGKVYIGKHEGPRVEDRWMVHVYRAAKGSFYHFHNAIRKYGAGAFKVEILYQAKSAVELSRMETFFIVLHQSHLRENGYNMTMGGDGVVPTEEVRRKLSLALKGKRNSLGSKRSVATIAKMSGVNNSFGFAHKSHSPESRDKMRTARLLYWEQRRAHAQPCV